MPFVTDPALLANVSKTSVTTPKPEEVFTPRMPPQRQMFTKRNEPDLHGNPGLQDSLRNALREPGGQVILYGDTGVGKSTLLKYAAEDEHMEVVPIRCRSKQTFDWHVDAAIREVTTDHEVEIVRSETKSGGGELGINKVITIKGHLENERGQQVRVEILDRTPLMALAETMQTSGLWVIAFDNFQNVDESERQSFAEAMEVLSDSSGETGDAKMVVLGVAGDAVTLVGDSGSVRRRTTEIGVPRMPDAEIREIFGNGFRLLGLKPEPGVILKLVFYCDGFPYFAHLLGLAVARLAQSRDEEIVDEPAVLAALVQAAKDVGASFPNRVSKALEAGGTVRPRERILRTLSFSGEREWRGAEVVEEYAALYSRPSDPGFLHASLGKLVKPEYGEVLARSGTPKRYVYRFSDPYMRPYLRMTQFTDPFQPRLPEL
jgi:hypothetical protein